MYLGYKTKKYVPYNSIFRFNLAEGQMKTFSVQTASFLAFLNVSGSRKRFYFLPNDKGMCDFRFHF